MTKRSVKSCEVSGGIVTVGPTWIAREILIAARRTDPKWDRPVRLVNGEFCRSVSLGDMYDDVLVIACPFSMSQDDHEAVPFDVAVDFVNDVVSRFVPVPFYVLQAKAHYGRQ